MKTSKYPIETEQKPVVSGKMIEQGFRYRIDPNQPVAAFADSKLSPEPPTKPAALTAAQNYARYVRNSIARESCVFPTENNASRSKPIYYKDERRVAVVRFPMIVLLRHMGGAGERWGVLERYPKGNVPVGDIAKNKERCSGGWVATALIGGVATDQVIEFEQVPDRKVGV